MQVTLESQERKAWYDKIIQCPATAKQKNDYDCYHCYGGFYHEGVPCIHKIGVRQRIINIMLKDPASVPPYFYEYPEFRRYKP